MILFIFLTSAFTTTTSENSNFPHIKLYANNITGDDIYSANKSLMYLKLCFYSVKALQNKEEWLKEPIDNTNLEVLMETNMYDGKLKEYIAILEDLITSIKNTIIGDLLSTDMVENNLKRLENFLGNNIQFDQIIYDFCEEIYNTFEESEQPKYRHSDLKIIRSLNDILEIEDDEWEKFFENLEGVEIRDLLKSKIAYLGDDEYIDDEVYYADNDSTDE
ncbi:hypothetical protein H312_01240 [Anncaliia algerae PRA339]|uniref:Uncharacterized protein n=1 Tax=Anncaliia algerae PRA339 TaxID=1288291 RepID=A0A059F2X5_9MICR|nr:hypothetical protein H312_01240 [Anncaliia algerae PRA339]